MGKSKYDQIWLRTHVWENTFLSFGIRQANESQGVARKEEEWEEILRQENAHNNADNYDIDWIDVMIGCKNLKHSDIIQGPLPHPCFALPS